MVQATQRVGTSERWASALERVAIANPIYMELIGGDGAFAVSSSADCEQGYVATVDTCTCQAGRNGDPVCLHRALVRALVGQLPVGPAPQTEACRDCCGCGEQWFPSGARKCDACQGSGRVVAPTSALFAPSSAH